MRIFPKVATVIFWTFMILMVIVTVTAYTRRSGHTGLDMAKIQELRSSPKEIPTDQTANN